MDYTWLILFLPLFSTIIITVFTRKHHYLSAYISCGAILASFVLSLKPLFYMLSHPGFEPIRRTVTWINLPGFIGLPDFTIEFGTLIDPLSICMLMVVTGVGSAIHIYSIGYMHGDRGFSRFFACLSLFTFSMLGIVLATNFIQIFIFWELVGVSSYLLIGFWYEKPSAAEAGKKAFLVNRIGDFGFMIGILILFFTVNPLMDRSDNRFDFVDLGKFFKQNVVSDTHHGKSTHGMDSHAKSTVHPGIKEHHPEQAASANKLGKGLLTLMGLLILCGAIGKSAQFPLHVWLPDAMEGPTPVSALIHAATMVAAGVYLIARGYFLFSASMNTLVVIAWIGGITAIFAASIALVQTDIKRVLAYSTLSQLGYMVLAMGVCGGFAVGMFHLTTHAFFKALLFLGAGSVIHAMHTNEIWEMGGLLKKMKITGITFLIATLAIAGIPPFAGFWSKDEILSGALHSQLPSHMALYAIAVIAAFMTSFYMSRMVIIVFFGEQRNKDLHPHESPAVMTYPLIFLAILSVLGGFMAWPTATHTFGYYLEGHHGEFHWNVAVSSTIISLLGIFLAYLIYYKQIISAEKIANHFRISYKLLAKKYYFDEFYLWIVEHIQQNFARLCNWFDQNILIEGMVNGTAGFIRWSGSVIRLSQTGSLQNYALVIVTGVALIILLVAIL